MAKKDTINKIPDNEIVWVEYLTKEHESQFLITSKESRDTYFLYAVLDNGYKRVGKAISPIALEEKYEVIERIRNNAE